MLDTFWWSKNFLCLKSIHIRYLQGPPGSGLYNGNKIMVIQRTNPFLLKETFIPVLLNAGFGNRFFIWWQSKGFWSFWVCSVDWRTERICEGCSCGDALQQDGITVESLEECVEKAILGMSLFFSWRNVRDETYYCVFGGEFSTEECVNNDVWDFICTFRSNVTLLEVQKNTTPGHNPWESG